MPNDLLQAVDAQRFELVMADEWDLATDAEVMCYLFTLGEKGSLPVSASLLADQGD